MLNAIKITNYAGREMTLDLRNPDSSGFLVSSCTGISPGKSDISLSEYSLMDGAHLNSTRYPSRNIVLNLYFRWKPDIEKSRHILYEFIPVKKPLTMHFISDHRTCKIDGYVEGIDANIFSSNTGCTVSIICPFPYFYAEDSTEVIISGITGGFEFPFSNESLAESLLEFGTTSTAETRHIYYHGEYETGLIFKLKLFGSTGNLAVFNDTYTKSMTIDDSKLYSLTGSNLRSGDEITITTVRGKKSIYLSRRGEKINIFNCLMSYTNWIELFPGDNIIGFSAQSNRDKVHLTVSYDTLYSGV